MTGPTVTGGRVGCAGGLGNVDDTRRSIKCAAKRRPPAIRRRRVRPVRRCDAVGAGEWARFQRAVRRVGDHASEARRDDRCNRSRLFGRRSALVCHEGADKLTVHVFRRLSHVPSRVGVGGVPRCSPSLPPSRLGHGRRHADEPARRTRRTLRRGRVPELGHPATPAGGDPGHTRQGGAGACSSLLRLVAIGPVRALRRRAPTRRPCQRRPAEVRAVCAFRSGRHFAPPFRSMVRM